MKYETIRDIQDLLYSIYIDFGIGYFLYIFLEFIIYHKVI